MSPEEEEVAGLCYILITNKFPLALEARKRLADLTGNVLADPALELAGNFVKHLYYELPDPPHHNGSLQQKAQAVKSCARELFDKTETTYRSCVFFCFKEAERNLRFYKREVAPYLRKDPFLNEAPNLASLERKLSETVAKVNRLSFGDPQSDIISKQWEPYFQNYIDAIAEHKRITDETKHWLSKWNERRENRARLRLQKLAFIVACIGCVLAIVSFFGGGTSVRGAVEDVIKSMNSFVAQPEDTSRLSR